MRTTFHTTSLTLLLQRLDLVPIEKFLLEELLGAASHGTYWQCLYRNAQRNPLLPIILQNIATKTRATGLTPIIDQLRKDHHYDQEPQLHSDVPDWQDAV